MVVVVGGGCRTVLSNSGGQARGSWSPQWSGAADADTPLVSAQDEVSLSWHLRNPRGGGRWAGEGDVCVCACLHACVRACVCVSTCTLGFCCWSPRDSVRASGLCVHLWWPDENCLKLFHVFAIRVRACMCACVCAMLLLRTLIVCGPNISLSPAGSQSPKIVPGLVQDKWGREGWVFKRRRRTSRNSACVVRGKLVREEVETRHPSDHSHELAGHTFVATRRREQ